jgi:hypothetical protein
MKNEFLYVQHTKTYFSFRRAVGLIGILLPFVLMLGNHLYFGEPFVLPSISQYYHSPMRDVFVGGLIAMAAFMFFYSGYSKWDRYAGMLAGLLTLGIVFFPTSASATSGGGKIHGLFAVLLFLELASISIFRFPRKRPGVDRRATDTFQVVCGLVMLSSMAAVLVYFFSRGFAKSDGCFVFVMESIALLAFGVSWFTEGLDLKREIAE